MSAIPASPKGSSRLSKDDLLLAVPKKGRLMERVVKLLEGAGLEHRRVSVGDACMGKTWKNTVNLGQVFRACPVFLLQPERVDVAKCTGLPVTLVFLPAADIAAYVGSYLFTAFTMASRTPGSTILDSNMLFRGPSGEGNVDMGITGQDILQETRLDYPGTEVIELLVSCSSVPPYIITAFDAEFSSFVVYSSSLGSAGAGLRQVRALGAGPDQGQRQGPDAAVGGSHRHLLPVADQELLRPPGRQDRKDHK